MRGKNGHQANHLGTPRNNLGTPTLGTTNLREHIFQCHVLTSECSFLGPFLVLGPCNTWVEFKASVASLVRGPGWAAPTVVGFLGEGLLRFICPVPELTVSANFLPVDIRLWLKVRLR